MLDALVTAAGAVVLGLLTNLLWRRFEPKTETWTPAVVGIVAAAVIIGVAVADRTGDTTSPSTSEGTDREPRSDAGDDTSPPASEPVSEPSPEATDHDPTTTPSSNNESVMATALTDLPAVTQDTNDDIDLETQSPLDAAGRTYGQALVYACSTYCDGSSPQVVTVSLGGNFRSFSTTATVLDSGEGTHRIDVTLDGGRPKTFTVAPGAPTPIELDVTGVYRMRVQLYAPGELKSPVQAGVDTTIGENGGGLPGVALGDPLFVP